MSLDVLRARVAFRDRSFLDVMDLALRFVAVHAKLYAKVAAMVLAPCAAITIATSWALGWVAGWCVAVLLTVVAQVPFTVLASRLVFQEDVGAGSVVRAAAREVPRIALMRLCWALLIGGAGLVFVMPGAWAAAAFLFVDEVMILERSRIGPAFIRAQRIASSAIGDAFVALAMVCVVPFFAMLLADVGGRAFIGEILQFRAPDPAWAEGGSSLAVMGWFGVLPYVTTARFFTYLNARTRTEGWDIQTRFAAIASRADRQPSA